MSDTPIAVTFFRNIAAASKTEERLALPTLAERIRLATAPRKDMLPWLKLARFGNQLSDKGSLRHNANVLAISGIEADYDGQIIPFDEAEEILTTQGVLAILYTTPSYAEAAPKWRVLCPLSEELPPHRHGPLLGRINGLFRGAFSGESFTLAQSYYFGSINHNPAHRVVLIDGQPIDLHDDLDEIWIGRAGATKEAADGAVSAETRKDAELVRCIITGEGLHVEMCALAARYVARGIPEETVKELLRGMMLTYPEAARDARWQDRYDSISDLVASATRKPWASAKPTRAALARTAFRLLRQDIPSAEALAALHDENRNQKNPLPPDQARDLLVWAAERRKEKANAR